MNISTKPLMLEAWFYLKQSLLLELYLGSMWETLKCTGGSALPAGVLMDWSKVAWASGPYIFPHLFSMSAKVEN